MTPLAWQDMPTAWGLWVRSAKTGASLEGVYVSVTPSRVLCLEDFQVAEVLVTDHTGKVAFPCYPNAPDKHVKVMFVHGAGQFVPSTIHRCITSKGGFEVMHLRRY